MSRDWDAAAYDRLPIPMTRWGEVVLEWLDLRGDERVLDAGCGTGRITGRLRERVPRGEVVALDGSASMIALARERLGEDRVTYVLADLQAPLPVDPPVDAVLSTATFHWVPDHEALFRHLVAVMNPGAQLAAQCGGGRQHRLGRGSPGGHGRRVRSRTWPRSVSATTSRAWTTRIGNVSCARWRSACANR